MRPRGLLPRFIFVEGKTDLLPRVEAGDLITCPFCAGEHTLEQGTQLDGTPSTLMFYRCQVRPGVYLGAVNNRLVVEPARPRPAEDVPEVMS